MLRRSVSESAGGSEDAGLAVLRSDDVMLFVDKPPGIVVQRGWDADEPVLFERAQKWAEARGQSVYLLQRLDRGTTGVLFFSLDASANRLLTRQFERREIEKVYLALVHGEIEEPFEIDAPIARIGPISFGVREGGKPSRTSVTPLARGPRVTLVRVRLHSGRTHQIRVHLAHAGHALVGDWLYGERDATRPMLHSHSITMPHPRTRETIRVVAPIPRDMADACTERGITLPSDSLE